MKTKLKIGIFAIFMLIMLGFSTNVQAASANISATKTTATVGDSVTITVNINAAAWNLKVTGSGVSGGSIVGYDPDGANTSTTKTFSLNTASAGSYTVYLTGDVTDGSTDANSGVSTSVTVKVNNPEPVTPITPPTTTTTPSTNNNSGGSGTNSGSNSNGNSSSSKPSTNTNTPKPEEKKSNDSTLKSLVVEGYELYPMFDTNTREYNLKVTNDIKNITVIPTVNNEKASYRVEGVNNELLVGENIITVIVTAEDGTTSNYVIKVTREREGLNVQHIKVFYMDEMGIKQELILNPVFSTEVFEYTLNNISHLVSRLDVDVLVNLEQAIIEITGNENLIEGENIVVVTATVPSESEEVEDEVLTYKIKVVKDKEPVITFMGRIENWFNGMTGTISTWCGEHIYEILVGSLTICCIALAGLSIYIVYDYKKYKLILERIAEITRLNNASTATNMSEEIKSNIEVLENLKQNATVEPEIKNKGRHF